MQSIKEFMLKEHIKIDKLLEDFENSLNKGLEDSKSKFNILKWNLEKHIFVEEKVIFSIYNKAKENEIEDIINLLKEHKNIEWSLNKIEESLKTNLKPQILELKKTLKSHVGIENNVFYPKLDKELNEKDRQLILQRIVDVIN